MKHYLITIIIPTYNCESTIEKAVDSIFNQSYKNVEILIIDGNSTDNTLKILQEYQQEQKNLVVHSESDKGIYDAMNKGIKLAKGEWLYFMGSDDTFYENTTLEKIVNTVKDSDCKVIYGNVKIIGDTGWAKDGDIYDGKFDTLKILNKNISHQAIFYNTKFIKEHIGLFNIDYTVCSDWDYNLRCWSRTDFYYFDILIANFFSGGLSTIDNDTNFEKDFIFNILKYFKIGLFDYLINNPNFRKYKRVKQIQKEYYPIKYKVYSLLNRISIKNGRKT